MQIFLGSDHQGFHLKEKILGHLSKRGYKVEDVGDDELDPRDDFPEFAAAAAVKVIGSEDTDPRAILICGGGQGMAMAANRFDGIRASVIWDTNEAKITRNDNDSNVLCLPSRLLDNEKEDWKEILDVWLGQKFAGAERYKRRNNQLDNLR
jgi:ribose 5-phosphate isomerase B